MRLSLLELADELGCLVERIVALPRASAVCCAAEKRERGMHRAHGPELHFVVAWFEADREVEIVQVGVCIEDWPKAIFLERSFLALVENQRQVAGERCEIETLDQLDHDGQAGLHVGCAGSVEQVALDARRPVMLGADGIEMPDEGDAGRVWPLCRTDDQAVMKAGNRVAAQAA